jgi:chromosomal replication initiation ATPase DnaA
LRNIEQLIFPVSDFRSYDVEDFIISGSNREAYNLLSAWPADWGVMPLPYALLLRGSPSSGKTHLAKIWAAKSGAYFLDIDNLQSVTSLNYDAFVLEDCQKLTARELLHLINILNENKKYLLLTCSISTNFVETLPDLTSRLNSILRIEIREPDCDLMRVLIFKYFSNRSVKLSNRAVEFILKELPGRFDLIQKILERIDRFALIHKKKVTVESVRALLSKISS